MSRWILLLLSLVVFAGCALQTDIPPLVNKSKQQDDGKAVYLLVLRCPARHSDPSRILTWRSRSKNGVQPTSQ
jgi:hypothetical protein